MIEAANKIADKSYNESMDIEDVVSACLEECNWRQMDWRAARLPRFAISV